MTTAEDALKSLKWLGHASFVLRDDANNCVYYVDPHDFKGSNYEKADIIFITHAHFDHCDADAVRKIVKPTTIIVVPSGCREKLAGINAKFFDVVPNSKYELEGFRFRAVPAYNNVPARLGFHPKANGGVGYVFSLGGQAIYHPGDTDYVDEMKRLGKISVALLPTGGTYTMDADEAIVAANAIRAEITVPMHYRGILKGNWKQAEEKFVAGVKNSRVVIMEEVA